MPEVSSRHRSLRLLPMIVVMFTSIITSVAAASGQESPHEGPPVPFFETEFDHLNSTADRLLAAPVPRIGREAAAGTSAIVDKPVSAPATIAKTSERPNKATSRVEQLRPIIDPILRKQGVPPELAAVAIIESGGQPTARSQKGARGVWQLMPDTARRYGLVVSAQRDERLDLVSATQAAAHYLHDLYAQFGDWELALAAYNAGEQAVSNAIQRARSNSFAVLSHLRLLPAETRNYVPAVVAASGPLKQLTATAESNSHKFANGGVFFALIAPDQQTSTDRP